MTFRWMVCAILAGAAPGPERATAPPGWGTIDLTANGLHGVLIDLPKGIEVQEQGDVFGSTELRFRTRTKDGPLEFSVVDDSGITDPEFLDYQAARAVGNVGQIVTAERDPGGWLLVTESRSKAKAVCRHVRSRRLQVGTVKSAGIYCASTGCVTPGAAMLVERACRTIRSSAGAK